MSKNFLLFVILPLALVALLVYLNPWGVRDNAAGLLSASSSAAADSLGADSKQRDEPKSPETKKQKLAKLPVKGVTVEEGDFVLTVAASGRTEAKRRVDLAPRVGERVTKVHVTEGDWVSQGKVLAELDSRPFEIALTESRAALSNAEADAEVRLMDDADASPEKRELVAHRSGLTSARQQVARAELDLESTRLTAPFAGYISQVSVATGTLVRANEPIFALVDISTVRFPAEVLESSFGRLQVGSSAALSFPALPGRVFTGVVTALSPEIDSDRGTGVAYIDIKNPHGLIKPGMFAEAEIAANTYENRISVPREAVLERERRLLVFKSVNDRAEWQYVETGLETDERIEITSGLAPGDTVLVEGHLTLAHAAPVRVSLRKD